MDIVIHEWLDELCYASWVVYNDYVDTVSSCPEKLKTALSKCTNYFGPSGHITTRVNGGRTLGTLQ